MSSRSTLSLFSLPSPSFLFGKESKDPCYNLYAKGTAVGGRKAFLGRKKAQGQLFASLEKK